MSKRNATGFHGSGLSASQAVAFAKIVSGSSVFLTGSAGTGKSEVIKRLVQYWESSGVNYAITATTGIAAVNIDGRTLHSLLWFLVGDDEPEVTLDMIYARNSQKGAFKWLQTSLRKLAVLVIDEVSMLKADLLEKASKYLSIIREKHLPFGGVQIVLVGDFFQLPPVFKAGQTKFLFESPIFYDAVKERCILQECFRQNDTQFVNLLGRMRSNKLTDEDREILTSRIGADVSRFGIEPTELYGTNRGVDHLNDSKLAQITTEPVVFTRTVGLRCSGRTVGEIERTTVLAKFTADIKNQVPESITLKWPETSEEEDAEGNVTSTHIDVGTQVMLTYNLSTERGLVNGSRGVVINFTVPAFGKRAAKSILEDFDSDDPEQRKVYLNTLHPTVRFIIKGKPTIVVVPLVRIERTEPKKSHEAKKPTAYAWYMPLKLAWACTVHKSQGLSLDCVSITADGTMFADGQAYVAVSRCRSLDGLTFKSFKIESVMASSKVIDFYECPFEECKKFAK